MGWQIIISCRIQRILFKNYFCDCIVYIIQNHDIFVR